MFRLTINIGSTADLFVARSASRALRNLSLPSPSLEGPLSGGGYATRLRYDESSDGGRARYILLLTEQTLPTEQRQSLVSRLEAGLSQHFDQLLYVPNQKAAEADIASVYRFCEALETELSLQSQKRSTVKQNQSDKKTAPMPPPEKTSAASVSQNIPRPEPRKARASTFPYVTSFVGVFALIIAGSAWWNVRSLSASYDTLLAQRLEEIEREVIGTNQSLEETKLFERVRALEKEITSLEKNSGDVDAALLAARESVKTVVAEVGQLDVTVRNVSTELAAVNNDLATIRTRNDELASALAPVEDRLSKLSTLVGDSGDLETTVASLKSLVGTLERESAVATNLQVKLSEIGSALTALEQKIAKATPRPLELRQEIDRYLGDLQAMVEMLDQIRQTDVEASRMAELSAAILSKNNLLQDELLIIQERVRQAIDDVQNDVGTLPREIAEIKSELETVLNRDVADGRATPEFGGDSLSVDDVKIAQEFLAGEGYQIDLIDGIPGPETRQIALNYLVSRIQILQSEQLVNQSELSSLDDSQMVALLLNYLAATGQLPVQ